MIEQQQNNRFSKGSQDKNKYQKMQSKANNNILGQKIKQKFNDQSQINPKVLLTKSQQSQDQLKRRSLHMVICKLKQSQKAQSLQFFVVHKNTSNKLNKQVQKIRNKPKPIDSKILLQSRKSSIIRQHVQRMRIPSDDIIHKQDNSKSLAQSITCPICLMIFQVPYYECQGCMNGFCIVCLQSWWKKSPNTCAFKCSNVQFKLIKRSNTYNALISMLKVACQYCRNEYTVQEISSHILKNCPQVYQICRFCGQKLSRKQIQNHENKDCELRPWKCIDCDQSYAYKQKQSHEQLCQEKLIRCQNQECQMNVKRRQFQQHIKNCQNKVITCQWCYQEMKLKQYSKHSQICEKRSFVCTWCNSTFKYTQSNQHQIKCELRKVVCKLCHEMVLFSQMSEHKIQCMFSNLIQIKAKNQMLDIENTRLKQKIVLLQGIIQENISNSQSNTMKVVTQMRQNDRKQIQRDLLRLDNSIKSIEKLKKQQFASHMRFPHLIQSWCPICRQLQKKFSAMLQPLFQQRKSTLTKLSQLQRFTYTPKPK